MRSDGTHVRRLTTSPFAAGPASIGTSQVAWNDAGDTAIAWSPGGGSLAFDAQNAVFPPDCFRNCVDWRVLIANSDGTGLQLVSDQAESPSWSPGGGRLAFVGSITPDLEGLEVTIATLATSATVHVKASSYNVYNAPAWSRTGLLAIESLRGEEPPQRIETVRANGTHRRQLVTGSDPAWSPSGARLAFIRNRHLYTVAASGGPVKLLTAPLVHAGRPAWSPNGRWIAYLRSVGRAGQPQLAVVPASGGVERLLTHVAKGYVFQTRPVWTPDGREVVFTVWRPKYA
jgi:Tol biopolymer transport system component